MMLMINMKNINTCETTKVKLQYVVVLRLKKKRIEKMAAILIYTFHIDDVIEKNGTNSNSSFHAKIKPQLNITAL